MQSSQHDGSPLFIIGLKVEFSNVVITVCQFPIALRTNARFLRFKIFICRREKLFFTAFVCSWDLLMRLLL